MAIPNLKLEFEVRAKVRIGAKNDGGYPRSVDHFLCDDPEVPGTPKVLRIVLPHADVEDNFSTGMEWWVKTKQGANQLACYTKDSGSNPVALRLEPYMGPDDVVVGEKLKQGRWPIACPFRECPMFKSQDGKPPRCKPKGRLVFFIDGGRTDSVLQVETSSWNSVERLTATLTGARFHGPLTGRKFDLSVAFQHKGRDRFPVLSLMEAEAMTQETDPRFSDALAIWDAADPLSGVDWRRITLAGMLDHTNPGWRDEPAIVDRIKELGVERALEALVNRCEQAVNSE